MSEPVCHGRFTVERVLGASPARVFEAYRDPEQRAAWGTPPGEVMLYERTDFAVGGVDIYRCGPSGDPRYSVRAQYQDIVPDGRIVYTERVSAGGTALFAALVTLELATFDGGTRLLLTDQMASFVGREMIDNARHGTGSALGNLGRFLG